jgi:hypothetical protein
VPSLFARASREIYRRELIPVRARWWLAAAGMCDWFRIVASKLRPHLGDRARPVIARLGARMFDRRYDALRALRPDLPPRAADPRALPLLMAGLYRLWLAPKARWILDGAGGAPRGPAEILRSQALLARLSAEERWEEVTTHLGDLLIVLTEGLPEELPHARKILGDICFDMGARFAERTRRYFGIPEEPDAPAHAIELLRMSEYIFRVNPKHWGHADAAANTGWLEGTACPWYTQPGWDAAHCGIFGQFQAGISSAFGLRYHLSKTIPKHGGSTCRIDLKPIGLRRGKDGAPLPTSR